MTIATDLKDFDFDALHSVEGLARLDAAFLARVAAQDPALAGQLAAYRSGRLADPLAVSTLLLDLGPLLGALVAELFGIASEERSLTAVIADENLVQAFKSQVVLRRARRYRKPLTAPFADLHAAVCRAAGAGADPELAIARYGLDLLAATPPDEAALDTLVQWAVRGLKDPDARAVVGGWTVFRQPAGKDYGRLIPIVRVPDTPCTRSERLHPREGFSLTDDRGSLREVMDQVHYCIYCHDHDGDFCSKGFPERKGEPDTPLRRNPLGNVLTGCPLNEKISEMHSLKRAGHSIAALAAAMADNPMVAATGHRICNDCSNACIYQKQEPVDIPRIETRVLTDVLELPWGVEIYDLLMRWNPLRATQYLPRPESGRRILIAGMGPAGFSLAHFLTMEGCTVVGIEARPVTPLPLEWLTQPVRDWRDLVRDLATRPATGFGGMSEHGIPARWDKNFLTLLHLCLARRRNFGLAGGVALGRSVSLEDCWAQGFEHVAMATGSGPARALDLPNPARSGVLPAIDFLDRLQSTPEARAGKLPGLAVRLPVVVIGGGLTAVDAATEVQAYYLRQAEAMLARFEELAAEYGAGAALAGLAAEDAAAVEEILDHGRQIRAARAEAAAAGARPDLAALVRRWGGVSLLYHGALEESAAYRRNAGELANALAEGVCFREGLRPLGYSTDSSGRVQGLRARRGDGGEEDLAAATVLVAVGLLPDTGYAARYPGQLVLAEDHYAAYHAAGSDLRPAPAPDHVKGGPVPLLTSYAAGGHRVSFLGDTHPLFFGSVVKAIASAQKACPVILATLPKAAPAVLATAADLVRNLRGR